MNKSFWAVIAVIIIIFGGIVVFSKKDSTAPTNAKPTNHLIGEGKSGVVLVEYGDFQCVFCGQYHPLIKQVVEKYKEQIHFQFRHLPLITSHQHALAAAKAAEAADKQGKFWEMYDLLFQNQSVWSASEDATTYFQQYATQLNLDLAKYKADAVSEAVNDTVTADIEAFKKTKERMSTPTFFLEGKKITADSLESFSKLIDKAIADKKSQ